MRKNRKESLIASWDARLSDHSGWMHKATSLIRAAEILASSANNKEIANMLRSFAVENLLKGIYTSCTGKPFPRLRGDTHDLMKIVEVVDKEARPGLKGELLDYEDVMDRLTRYSWAGRYPRPIKEKDSALEPISESEKAERGYPLNMPDGRKSHLFKPRIYWNQPHDDKLFADLVDKLYSMLE